MSAADEVEAMDGVTEFNDGLESGGLDVPELEVVPEPAEAPSNAEETS
jgi:hypothetical protein